MEITIQMIKAENPKQIFHFKDYLEKNNVMELENISINRTKHENGEMGIGSLLMSVSAIVKAAQEPLSELIKCIQKYIDSFKSEIILKNSKGDELLIISKKLDANSIEKMIEMFVLGDKESSNNPIEKE